VAEVAPSTASVHLQRLVAERLVTVFSQGRHRYYSLAGPAVGAALEALQVLAGGAARAGESRTPLGLRAARTCYDHIAGTLGVALHDRLTALGWLSTLDPGDHSYDITAAGTKGLRAIGIDPDAVRAQRRRFAYACVDWSERRPHLGGALAAALLHTALKKRWLEQYLDSRALTVTSAGRREMAARFGLPGPRRERCDVG
jgi:hypothetical protein